MLHFAKTSPTYPLPPADCSRCNRRCWAEYDPQKGTWSHELYFQQDTNRVYCPTCAADRRALGLDHTFIFTRGTVAPLILVAEPPMHNIDSASHAH